MTNVRTLPAGEGNAEMQDTLDQLAREGARRMIAAALRAEADEYVERFSDEVDEDGHRRVVRNGRARQRKVTIGSGTIPVRTPRVNDKRIDGEGERQKFSSRILPAYARRSPKVGEVIPILYLKGLSTGDFRPALEGLLGEDAAGLSASTVCRLCKDWEAHHDRFRQRLLSFNRYATCSWTGSTSRAHRRGNPAANRVARAGSPAADDSADVREPLRLAHKLALWVATLDPYASRDSLHAALGDVAILHQERRLGGDSPLSLVLSQRSGGPADRAIGRSLKAAGIVADRDVALEIGGELRKVASQGYGILALEAATTGAVINELVGHVVAFSLLSRRATPWPLPPDCRILLASLDDYKHWFPVKRADLLVLALDTAENGVHAARHDPHPPLAAVIEVKARRSSGYAAHRVALSVCRS